VLLLDAGVWIAAKDDRDPHFEVARQLVLGPETPVAALDLTLYEVANVAGARWRREDVAREICRTIAARCGDRLVSATPELIDAAMEVVAAHGLTAYDAAYVAAARAGGMTLVSTDVRDLVSRGLAIAPDAADYPLRG
jgi:predicted nucleic acid-binding protein